MANCNITELQAGVRIGSLVLQEPITSHLKNGKSFQKWRCNCDCGNQSLIHSSTLSQGLIRHCENCRVKRKRRERVFKKRERHGLGSGRTYTSYLRMITRIHDSSHKDYKNYGARGITVCDRWMNSYLNFLEDMGERPEDKSLDRIDNNKGYSPENCRWADRFQQNRNRRNTVFVEINNIRRVLSELIDEKNKYYELSGADVFLSYDLVYARIKNGWSPQKALDTPPRNRRNDVSQYHIQLKLPLFLS